NDFGSMYLRAVEHVFKRLDRLVDNGRLTEPEADGIYHDLVNRALDAAGIIEYQSSRGIPLPPGMAKSIIPDAAKDARETPDDTGAPTIGDEELDARVYRQAQPLRPEEVLAGLPRGNAEAAARGPGRSARDNARPRPVGPNGGQPEAFGLADPDETPRR